MVASVAIPRIPRLGRVETSLIPLAYLILHMKSYTSYRSSPLMVRKFVLRCEGKALSANMKI